MMTTDMYRPLRERGETRSESHQGLASDSDDGGICGCICVTPEAHASGTLTLQGAIDRVFAGGGDICLAPGRYFLQEALKLVGGQSIALRGRGRPHLRDALEPPLAVGAHVFGPAGVLNVQDTIGLTLENLFLESTEAQPAIVARDVTGLTVRDSVIAVTRPATSAEVQPAISFSRRSDSVRIAHNQILAPIGIAWGTAEGPAEVARLEVDGNRLLCEDVALSFADVSLSRHCTLERNRIERRDAGILVLGTAAADASFQIRDNELHVRGPGIRFGSPERFWSGRQRQLDIADNDLRGSGASFGLAILHQTSGDAALSIARNRVRGFEAGIALSVRGEPRPARDLRIENNVVEACSAWGILAVDSASAQHWCIRDNRLLQMTAGGIGVWGGRSAHISGNALRQVAAGAATNRLGVGIFCDAFGDTRLAVHISNNELTDIGPEPTFEGRVAGILVGQGANSLEMFQNHVARGDAGTTGLGDWVALDVSVAALTLISAMTQTLRAPLGVTVGGAPRPRMGRSTVSGNVLTGSGNQSAVRILMPLDASGVESIFSNNQVFFNGPDPDPTVPPGDAVSLTGSSFVLCHNRISGQGLFSLNFDTPQAGFNTVLGNITVNDIRFRGVPSLVPSHLNALRIVDEDKF
jgi:hypothetical protein